MSKEKDRQAKVSDDQIVEEYERNKSTYKVAKLFGISDKTVTRILRLRGIPRVGLQHYRDNATMFVGQEQEIWEAYNSGMTFAELREKFGEASDYAYKYAIRRVGGVLREHNAKPLRPVELQTIKDMNAGGVGQEDIAYALGRSQSFVSRWMRKNGIPRQAAKYNLHGMWKGGRIKDGSGYYRVLLPDDDTYRVMTMNDGYVMEHRLVMARHLDRPLLRTETVHHINGDKADNRIENLQLRQGRHGKHTVMCCLECGSRKIGHTKL